MCTRIFENRFEAVRVVGRTLDWEVSDEALLWHFPRGLVRDGGCDAAATWEIEHRNLAISMWGTGSTEGLNEAGLSAHLLYLGSSDYGKRDDRPGVSWCLWAQYVLDRFGSVAEALDHLDDAQIVQRAVRGQTLGGHLSLEDSSGDSAIIEILDGSPIVHHGREFQVMANDPSYEEQLASLKRFRAFGGTEGLPGDIISDQRFARATFFLQHLTEPRNEREAVAGVLSVTRNASVPFGAPYDDFVVYPTWWASVMDLVRGSYYFQSTLAPNVVWALIDGVAPELRSEVLSIDPSDPSLSGDITPLLREAERPY
jgi:choloylglycine hydrolase